MGLAHPAKTIEIAIIHSQHGLDRSRGQSQAINDGTAITEQFRALLVLIIAVLLVIPNHLPENFVDSVR